MVQKSGDHQLRLVVEIPLFTGGFQKGTSNRWFSRRISEPSTSSTASRSFLIRETWSTSQLGESWAPDVTLARFLGGSSSTGGLSSWVKPFITWFEDLMNLPFTVQKKIILTPISHQLTRYIKPQWFKVSNTSLTHPLPTAERAPGVCVHCLQDKEATEFNQQFIQRSLSAKLRLRIYKRLSL